MFDDKLSRVAEKKRSDGEKDLLTKSRDREFGIKELVHDGEMDESKKNDTVSCGDNHSQDGGDNEYDEPYCDENDMYFMDDGGYNSFVLEIPCSENAGMNINSGDKSSSFEIAVGIGIKTKEKLERSAHPDVVESKQDEGSDSFKTTEIQVIDGATHSHKTPQREEPRRILLNENKFKTPNNPLSHQGIMDETFSLHDDLTPQPEDKNACQQFQPGCSVHPETKEVITPMPNYAQYSTPDLKVLTKLSIIKF